MGARSAGEAGREAARFVLGERVTGDFRRDRRSAAALLAQWRTAAPESRVALPHVINALVANGLLVVRGAGETAEYELTHDFLAQRIQLDPVSYTHLRAHETVLDLVCRLLLAKKKHHITTIIVSRDAEPITESALVQDASIVSS